MDKNKQIRLKSRLTTITSYSVIIESNKLSTILEHINNPNTLIIFDIDNTIAHPTEELGSDEWSSHLISQKMGMGYDEATAICHSDSTYFYVQFNIALQPTEPGVSDLIAYLISNKIPTMALTARSLFISEITLEQLKKINITFCVPGISHDALALPMAHPCFYKEGILFTDEGDKGESLKQFFINMQYYPEKVIFVDDKMQHLLTVKKILEELNIDFCGIRYSGCDEKVKNFDPIKAEQQYQKLREKNGKKCLK